MQREPVFRNKYVKFIREYESLRLSSTGPRPIFFSCRIGLAPSSTGVTINLCLYAGPKLQRDIVDNLLNFRRHQVGFEVDIRMMFRLPPKEDTNFGSGCRMTHGGWKGSRLITNRIHSSLSIREIPKWLRYSGCSTKPTSGRHLHLSS